MRKLKSGAPFPPGLALDLQEQARSELEVSGAIEAMKQTYSRHAAVALYLFGALNGRNDLSESAALRILSELRRVNRDAFAMLDRLHELGAAASEQAIDYEAMLAARKAGDNEG
jgi:hypothetical protein